MSEFVTEIFPRNLRAKERELLDFVLPAARLEYNEYRKLIAAMVVLAEGRRGKGNFILGKRGDHADIRSPLAAVFAYGMLETTLDVFTITVRECVGDQIDVEIVSGRGEEIPDHFEEKRRWTYSLWTPGELSPATRLPVREVNVNDTLTLVIAKEEKRIWLHDRTTMVNHLIPITNFYNELMLHKRIRDPKIALKSSLLFEELEKYADADLRAAFVTYNKVKKKVDIRIEQPVQEEKRFGLFSRSVSKRNPAS